jgi:hypothetical protein
VRCDRWARCRHHQSSRHLKLDDRGPPDSVLIKIRLVFVNICKKLFMKQAITHLWTPDFPQTSLTAPMPSPLTAERKKWRARTTRIQLLSLSFLHCKKQKKTSHLQIFSFTVR